MAHAVPQVNSFFMTSGKKSRKRECFKFSTLFEHKILKKRLTDFELDASKELLIHLRARPQEDETVRQNFRLKYNFELFRPTLDHLFLGLMSELCHNGLEATCQKFVI